MDLIKEDFIKRKSVYRADNFIRKYWHDKNFHWVKNHAIRVAMVVPDYVIKVGEDCSGVYMDMNILPGLPASTFEHTDEFINKVYQFCLDNLKQTYPFAHGDWVLSNMLIDGDIIRLCDWDNIDTHPRKEIIDKLHRDLHSAFGNKFYEIINDSAGI